MGHRLRWERRGLTLGSQAGDKASATAATLTAVGSPATRTKALGASSSCCGFWHVATRPGRTATRPTRRGGVERTVLPSPCGVDARLAREGTKDVRLAGHDDVRMATRVICSGDHLGKGLGVRGLRHPRAH